MRGLALGLWVSVGCSGGADRSKDAAPVGGPAAGVEAVAAPTVPPLPALDAALIRRHIAALSDDAMEGRRPGTPGGAAAVVYVREQMQALGLSPAGEDGGWTQTVPMRSVRLDPARSSLALRRGTDEPMPLAEGERIVAVAMGPSGTTLVDAPLYFVGYGVTAPEYDWDDYGDADLTGAIAVVLVGDPPVEDGRFDGPAMTYYGRWSYKFERALAAGAEGCLVVHETKPASYDWAVVRSSWSGERFDLRRPSGEPRPSLAVQGWIDRELGERLAGFTGGDLARWHARAMDPGFEPEPIGADLVARLTTTERSFTDANVLGAVPGRTHPDQFVLVTAHWDHLGVDPDAAPGQDAIFNGAIDNASGVAGLLALAVGLQARVAEGLGPGRSVLLLATTAEEQGLLGSRHYAEHPLVPRSSIVGVANLDSMNVHGRTTAVSVTGRGRTTLEDVLEQVVAEQGRTVVGEARPEAGGYFRSDHFSFARQGVPALDFHGGPALEHGGRAAGEALAHRRAERYHTVNDELDESWTFEGTVQDVQALLELVIRVAEAEARPEWKPGFGPSAGGPVGSRSGDRSKVPPEPMRLVE